MIIDPDAYIRIATGAVTGLLLGNRPMKDSVMVSGGDPLPGGALMQLSRRAALAETDVIHLEFAATADGSFGLSGITLVLPRDNGCHVIIGCRLWLNKSSNRALIVPPETFRGHFKLLPGELVHLRGKPAGDPSDGVRRATTWLQERVQSHPAEPSINNLFDLRDVA